MTDEEFWSRVCKDGPVPEFDSSLDPTVSVRRAFLGATELPVRGYHVRAPRQQRQGVGA